MKFLLDFDPEENNLHGTDEQIETEIIDWIKEGLDPAVFSIKRVEERQHILYVDDKPYVEDKLLSRNNMLHVGGSPQAFRCGCGANVFSKWEDEKGIYYECNGCYTIYRGEKDDNPRTD